MRHLLPLAVLVCAGISLYAGLRYSVRGTALPRCCCVGLGAARECWPPPQSSGGRPYRILFHANQFGPRGTEVNMYSLARAFEELACGEAHAVSFRDGAVQRPEPHLAMASYAKFVARFPGRVHLLNTSNSEELDALVAAMRADAVYSVQAGHPQWGYAHPTVAKLLIHAVFDGSQPRGHAFAVVSDSVTRVAGVPVVPNIVEPSGAPPAGEPSLRVALGLPRSARVFCRHGGATTFNIEYARQAVCNHARQHPGDAFLLKSTEEAPCEAALPNIIHLPHSSDPPALARYLQACDACVHGRMDGETFGLAVAECSAAGLPVITTSDIQPAFHLTVLGAHAILYHDQPSLRRALESFDPVSLAGSRQARRDLYAKYFPEQVMLTFLREFNVLEDVKRAANPMGLPLDGVCKV
jgi:hypothetical protein